MSQEAEKTAKSTLESLRERLNKVQWYLTGGDHNDHGAQAMEDKVVSVQTQLANLERSLGTLSSKSPVVRELLRLSRWKVSLEFGQH